jgi:hypothetical protein
MLWMTRIFFKEITTLQKTGGTSEKICTPLLYSSDDVDLGNTLGTALWDHIKCNQ